MNEEELEKKAIDEIMKEAARGRERANEFGPSGWLKPKTNINKNFLRRTLKSAQHDLERSTTYTHVKENSRDREFNSAKFETKQFQAPIQPESTKLNHEKTQFHKSIKLRPMFISDVSPNKHIARYQPYKKANFTNSLKTDEKFKQKIMDNSLFDNNERPITIQKVKNKTHISINLNKDIKTKLIKF